MILSKRRIKSFIITLLLYPIAAIYILLLSSFYLGSNIKVWDYISNILLLALLLTY